MKNIPIVILNKDRFGPTKDLVDSLLKRNYNNITIIDNESTYEPLLEWYKVCGVDVFINDIPQTLYDTGTLYRLSKEIRHPKFVDIVKDYYVFTDSDTVPVEEAPEDFIDHMVALCDEFHVHKVGLGLKLDDLPDFPTATHHINGILEKEAVFWQRRIMHDDYELFHGPIDTTFAVYAPNSNALYGENTIRMGGTYQARHMPWYYDTENLPEDEAHYLKYLRAGRGPNYSMVVKNALEI